MKTKIDYLDYTWNPIMGCLNGCNYCWARNRIAPRLAHNCQKCGQFIPHFHRERLNEIDRIKMPSIIGVNFMADTWGLQVSPEWRDEIFNKISKSPIHKFHKFVILTKQPQNILECKNTFSNLWVGISITKENEIKRWDILAGKDFIRHKFIAFEPLLEYIDIPSLFPLVGHRPMPEWIIIGAMTGMGSKSKEHSQEMCQKSLKTLLELNHKYRPPVFVKDNCGIKNAPKEYPKEMI
jgi:protein gp37